MMYQWLVFTLICFACLVTGAIVGILWERTRRESREIVADIAEYEKRGRHAKTQPRTQLVAASRPRTVMPWYTPLPGPDKPQAGRDSGAGTVTFPRIDLPATTGEMAAITDQYLADMAVQEETYRLGLST